VYYPPSKGGGARKLFRKVGDKSSEFLQELNDVRRDGSYLYEQFFQVDSKPFTV
jgi:inositol hexakisphosphate/diphosphoinositol-pentakisphosphate kinase